MFKLYKESREEWQVLKEMISFTKNEWKEIRENYGFILGLGIFANKLEWIIDNYDALSLFFLKKVRKKNA